MASMPAAVSVVAVWKVMREGSAKEPAALARTQWFTPTFYPSREGWYEARFYSMPSADARTPDVYDRVRFDGVDWELEDNQVLVAWRGLVEDPAGDL